jgi:hypothetical protein
LRVSRLNRVMAGVSDHQVCEICLNAQIRARFLPIPADRRFALVRTVATLQFFTYIRAIAPSRTAALG